MRAEPGRDAVKLATFKLNGRTTLAVDSGDHWVALDGPGAARLADLHDYLELGDSGPDRVRQALADAPDEARFTPADGDWAPPTMRAGKILCLGLNYHEHREETGAAPNSPYPTVFMRANASLIAHRAPIQAPAVSAALDFEGELVAVIGRRIRDAGPDTALEAVAGYSLFNDVSVRDYQFKSSQWTVGKNFDGTGAFGPWMTTREDLPPGAAGLELTVTLNGEVVQSANTADMIHSVAETIVLLSEAMTLEVGDLIVTGTPGGVGMARNPPLWMKPGDVCAVEIERIGRLHNVVASPPTLPGAQDHD